MTQGDEWSAWQDHDGTCMPVPAGTPVRGRFRGGAVDEWLAGTRSFYADIYVAGLGTGAERIARYGGTWFWQGEIPHQNNIVAYQVRRPRGMAVLDALIADIPVLEDA